MVFPCAALAGLIGAALICGSAGLSGWFLFPLAAACTLAGSAAFLLFVAAVCLFVRLDRPAPPDAKFFRWLTVETLRLLMVFFRVDIRTDGYGRIPRGERFLLACNHRTIFDPVLTIVALREFEVSFITKRENYGIPVVNKLMHRIFCLPFDRSDARSAVAVFHRAADLMKADLLSMGIYPEGTRNRTAEPLLPFKNGSFKIAQMAGAPVVAATIRNTDRILKNAPWRRTTVYLRILEVIPAETLKEQKTRGVAERLWPLLRQDLLTPPPEGPTDPAKR